MVANHEIVALRRDERPPIFAAAICGRNSVVLSGWSVVDVKIAVEDLYRVTFDADDSINQQFRWFKRIVQLRDVTPLWSRVSIGECTDQQDVAIDVCGSHCVVGHSCQSKAQAHPDNEQRDQASQDEAGGVEIREETTPLHLLSVAHTNSSETSS